MLRYCEIIFIEPLCFGRYRLEGRATAFLLGTMKNVNKIYCYLIVRVDYDKMQLRWEKS
jgi:hypothetical protein